MQRNELIKYIQANDPYYVNADFSQYSDAALVLIKASIELEVEKKKEQEKVKKAT